MRGCRLLPLVLLATLPPAPGGPGRSTAEKDIQAVVTQGRGTAAGRAAWDRVAAGGPEVLLPLLRAMDTRETASANWLRTAFDRVLDRALKAGGKSIDAGRLLAFARDTGRAGRARRLALEAVERLRPGTSAGLFRGWLEDPEFRYDAVAQALNEAAALVKSGDRGRAVAGYRRALEASRDQQQAREAAGGLLDLSVKASVAEHMGFLTEWYLIGPFDARGMKGFTTSYPPEKGIDLKAEYPGQNGKVRWVYYRVREPSPRAGGRHVALVDLRAREALGDADDAVAYAYTEFTVPRARAVEIRGSADDNFTVWVNGAKAFAFEEYRNGVRLDRHRFRVGLRAGRNTVLVKVCQAPANPEPNWEFFLRVCDETGKGLRFQSSLR
jgi:hypothetical protein